MQTSPISFVARGKGTFSVCNKGNRRRLHAGKKLRSLKNGGGTLFPPCNGQTRHTSQHRAMYLQRRSSCDVVRNKRMGSKAFTSCLLIPENCDRMLVSNPDPAQAARKGTVCSTKKYLRILNFFLFSPSCHCLVPSLFCLFLKLCWVRYPSPIH